MMRTILVPMAQELPNEPAFETALTLAKRMNSHVRALFVRPDPRAAIAYIPEVVAATGITQEAIEREGREAAKTAKAWFESWRLKHNLPGAEVDRRLDSCFASWTEKLGELEAVIGHHGRVSDLIVTSGFGEGGPRDVWAERCFDAAVFGSGRPVLLANRTPAADLADHVVIAWSGSLEASRAVFGAMELLHAANRVSVFCAPTSENDEASGTELSEALAWHGVRTHRIEAPRNPSSIGEALLAAVAKQQASLIVMGAYTHSRVRQSFLGGVTRYVLAHTGVPVLMCH